MIFWTFYVVVFIIYIEYLEDQETPLLDITNSFLYKEFKQFDSKVIEKKEAIVIQTQRIS